MLLTCLGYDSGREHYTGSYWSANVDIQASSEGLYRKLTGFKPNENLSRDNAAQMIWNALYAKMVQYDGNTLDRGITLLESKYGIKPEKTETQTKGMCGYWTNFIQDVDVCRFYEDGSGEWLDRYDDDHTNFQYTLQGSQLTLHYKNGYQTVLDYITLDELLQTENYDGFTQRIIEELSLPGDFRFYYETNWDYTDPFGNAMFLVPANIIPNKVEESNYWYQSIRMLINTM